MALDNLEAEGGILQRCVVAICSGTDFPEQRSEVMIDRPRRGQEHPQLDRTDSRCSFASQVRRPSGRSTS